MNKSIVDFELFSDFFENALNYTGVQGVIKENELRRVYRLFINYFLDADFTREQITYEVQKLLVSFSLNNIIDSLFFSSFISFINQIPVIITTDENENKINKIKSKHKLNDSVFFIHGNQIKSGKIITIGTKFTSVRIPFKRIEKVKVVFFEVEHEWREDNGFPRTTIIPTEYIGKTIEELFALLIKEFDKNK